MKVIYTKGHINTIQPYYFMLNGQRYNAAHFNGNIIFGMPKATKYTPFFVENISGVANTLKIQGGSDNPHITIEYSTDEKTWQLLGTTGYTKLTKTIQPGERLYLRSKTDQWSTDDFNHRNTIKGVDKIGGNIMSLLYGEDFTGNETTFPGRTSYQFSGIFENSGIRDVSELILPATILRPYCYSYMFYNCLSLITPPVLPATTMGVGCYYNMFFESGITTAPELPATTLAMNCYLCMFSSCDDLVTAPAILPATTLETQCYGNMFSSCNNLENAPELPATHLVSSCYFCMFLNCNKIDTIKCLATSGFDNYEVLDGWTTGVKPRGTFYKAAGTTWPTGTSGIPTGWTVVEV